MACRRWRAPTCSPFAFIGLAWAIVFIFLRPEPYELADPSALAPHPEGTEPSSVAALLRTPAVLVALVTLAAGQVVMVLIMTMTPLHLTDHGHGLATVGIVLSAHTFGMFALSPITGRLVDRFGSPRIIAAGLATLAVAALIAAGAPPEGGAVLTLALFLLGYGWNLGFVAGSSMLTSGLTLARADAGPGRGGRRDLDLGGAGQPLVRVHRGRRVLHGARAARDRPAPAAGGAAAGPRPGSCRRPACLGRALARSDRPRHTGAHATHQTAVSARRARGGAAARRHPQPSPPATSGARHLPARPYLRPPDSCGPDEVAGGGIHGTVVDPEDNPLNDIFVSIQTPDGFRGETHTGEDGVFTALGVSGDFQITTTDIDYAEVVREVTVPCGELVDVELVLVPVDR